jgi:hypothetical protein
MSLERKDVRAYLDPDDHRALLKICEIDGVEPHEYVENLLVPVIRKRVHDAVLLAQEFRRDGTSRKGPE